MHAQAIAEPRPAKLAVVQSDDDLLTPQQAAARMGLAVATLQRQRTDGFGPKFIKLGKRRVAYRWGDIRDWLDTRVAESTADARVRGLAA